ncbi:hypothetical protein BpHYR1_042293 [Brachionus plicatilis]|uniref:Uncharacterized protein n=1 Tax=Brachionus plicatilis TaxID=10195 RepID=A0A3M7PYL9_BRAPC|nr:hypothetical protein BpHYR1_042293 [Brachionus plicatilis]
MVSFLLFVLSVLTYSMTKILLTYRKTVKYLKTVVESKKDERKKIYNTIETQNKQRTKIYIGNKFEEEIEMVTIGEILLLSI